MIFTSDGIINIRNKKWSDDFTPLDRECPSEVSRNYTKAYLRHLIISGELLGAQIASIHNLSFYMNLVREARNRIEAGDFLKWKNSTIKKVSERL
jgi:queuine tRNA-ribosyltransferase